MCCTSKRGKFKHLTLFSFSAFFPCDFFEDIEFSQQAIRQTNFIFHWLEILFCLIQSRNLLKWLFGGSSEQSSQSKEVLRIGENVRTLPSQSLLRRTNQLAEGARDAVQVSENHDYYWDIWSLLQAATIIFISSDLDNDVDNVSMIADTVLLILFVTQYTMSLYIAVHTLIRLFTWGSGKIAMSSLKTRYPFPSRKT